MHNCHIKKWRASWLAYLWESEYYNQGTVYRAEYQLQYVGNNGSNIAKFEPDGSHRCSHCNIQKTICTLVRTWWTNARLKVTVSYIAWLPVMRCGVTTTSWSQNGSLWNGDVSFPSKKKFKMQPSADKSCALSFGIAKGSSFWISWNPDKPSTVTTSLWCWLNWRLKLPESGQRRRHSFSGNTLTPGLIPVWKSWSTSASLGWTVLLYPPYSLDLLWNTGLVLLV